MPSEIWSEDSFLLQANKIACDCRFLLYNLHWQARMTELLQPARGRSNLTASWSARSTQGTCSHYYILSIYIHPLLPHSGSPGREGHQHTRRRRGRGRYRQWRPRPGSMHAWAHGLGQRLGAAGGSQEPSRRAARTSSSASARPAPRPLPRPTSSSPPTPPCDCEVG